MISFEGVTKIYGNNRVLNNINLKISEGEFVSIVGVSGAGKTTLIEALIGNLKLEAGKIMANGVTVTNLNQKDLQTFRRTVGVVFQDFQLLPNKTVEENVAFAMEVCGEEDFEIFARVHEVLALVDMVQNKDQFPHQLSGGEKQRVAIARALVHNPRIVIADEPTGNLDPHQSEEIVKLLMRINEYGVTVILATHDKSLVNIAEKRVITLHDGEIVSDWQQGKYDAEILILEKEIGGIEIITVE
ncbi:MAG: ATP-binding cassette domain-containing protein [Candidatus Peregrinibacteria bacterium]|nr:ATP-binding cassette domain-containing protein [Candidatus Peregrinibacteria bacterium]MDZ4244698.1 ATP-binding cassette domain-containing protein [Candidatus Gracilibacteria bacterium]